jgi:hypothetical protein
VKYGNRVQRMRFGQYAQSPFNNVSVFAKFLSSEQFNIGHKGPYLFSLVFQASCRLYPKAVFARIRFPYKPRTQPPQLNPLAG